ncbi:hypothetical protein FAZ19_13530 [Sphingobacterium alkalisoli]|uniref:Uncharacterized protein n=1 Tax=Sphingobacterium alkalisoli TaxID=1874115 RepID=A0A4V5LXW7_9SPHI|nr:DUF6492 family protein [Sphingobacterium alkalisoli]TJY64229.1 hypothetical protein FAZ19_13530 [Sphingobacterium alkalisoli]GGH23044.1 hypothetical protein GCM10011418_30010 [Sphingobacterium alkalisoli]
MNTRTPLPTSYEIVVCIGPQHLEIAKTTIRYLYRLFDIQRIIVIINPRYFQQFTALKAEIPILALVDENTLFDSFNFHSISQYMLQRLGDDKRSGWYFQQFLKMEAHKLVNTAYYLIWDADTVPLAPINFFKDQHSVWIHPGEEHHQPYFDTLYRLLGIPRIATNSFISEHLMVSKKTMRLLIESFQKKSLVQPWPLLVLESIDEKQLPFSGFSEYETYGNFALVHFPDQVTVRKNTMEKIKSYRHGSQLFGNQPNEESLYVLKEMGFHYVTFEVWDQVDKKTIRKNEKIAWLFNFLHRNNFPPFLTNKILQKVTKQLA